jgi:hypothetical protein
MGTKTSETQSELPFAQLLGLGRTGREDGIWASARNRAQPSRYYDFCRGRDLLAGEYASRVLLAAAARQVCFSEFHFIGSSALPSARHHTISCVGCAWTAPASCLLRAQRHRSLLRDGI